MKYKLLLASLAAVVAVAVAGTGSVSATDYEKWDFGLSGTGSCQTDGSFKIVWNVDNPNNKYLKVFTSSNEAVVPVGTQVPKNESANFEQTVDGTQPATYELELKAGWPNNQDQDRVTNKTAVTLREACPQPAPEEGKGAVATPQVQTPTGAVKAGGGGGLSSSASSLVGLASSISLAGFGLRRLNREL